MKSIGIVSEFNPFHNGHKYLVDYVKKNYPDTTIIALTTNYFSMNGSLSVINKYDKTKIEIESGIDLVLEYPYLLSCHSADKFCYNAVKLLNDFGVSEIIAGSECNNLEEIIKVSEAQKDISFQNKVKEFINEGNSYRESYSKALSLFGMPDLKSNDLLNLKYYEAIKEINPSIKLSLIKRVNNDYLDNTVNTSIIQSATSIRTLLDNNEDISTYVPFKLNHVAFYKYENFTNILNYLITSNDLSCLYEAKEGIENLFKEKKFESIEECVNSLTTKRYTKSRIRRFLTYILTNRKNDEVETYTQRVLGMSFRGSEYLKEIKDKVPYTTKIRNGVNNVSDFELKVAKLFSSVYNEDFVFMEQFYLPFVRKDL